MYIFIYLLYVHLFTTYMFVHYMILARKYTQEKYWIHLHIFFFLFLSGSHLL